MTRPAAAATIVAAAGRRIDAAGATSERFPLRNRDRVRGALSSVLAAAHASILVSSAACGADLLAVEAATALGIRCRVILPFAVHRFRASSVIDRPGDWGPLFDRVIAWATSKSDLVILGDAESENAYARTNAAILREGDALAAATGADRIALVAWDGASRGPDDLTEQFRIEATSRGWTITEVPTL